MLHKLNCRCFDELSRLRGPKPVTPALQGRCTVNRVRFFRVFSRVGALPELRSLVLEKPHSKRIWCRSLDFCECFSSCWTHGLWMGNFPRTKQSNSWMFEVLIADMDWVSERKCALVRTASTWSLGDLPTWKWGKSWGTRGWTDEPKLEIINGCSFHLFLLGNLVSFAIFHRRFCIFSRFFFFIISSLVVTFPSVKFMAHFSEPQPTPNCQFLARCLGIFHSSPVFEADLLPK